MSPAELRAFRNELLALANRAEEVRSELSTEESAAIRDGSLVEPYRPAEMHNQAAGEVVTSQLRELEAGVERDAMEAIERIDKGTFGKCLRCGQAIPKGRLQAIPYVKTCVKCAG
jgi:RNA polymerase-binding transcription factor DksA